MLNLRRSLRSGLLGTCSAGVAPAWCEARQLSLRGGRRGGLGGAGGGPEGAGAPTGATEASHDTNNISTGVTRIRARLRSNPWGKFRQDEVSEPASACGGDSCEVTIRRACEADASKTARPGSAATGTLVSKQEISRTKFRAARRRRQPSGKTSRPRTRNVEGPRKARRAILREARPGRRPQGKGNARRNTPRGPSTRVERASHATRGPTRKGEKRSRGAWEAPERRPPGRQGRERKRESWKVSRLSYAGHARVHPDGVPRYSAAGAAAPRAPRE